MTPEAVQRWLNAYSHAWETYDPREIADLFADSAEYRWHPWDQGDGVARGRQAIVDAWLSDRDPIGTYQGRYRPQLVQGNDAVAVGTSHYHVDASRSRIDREYHNLFLLKFTDAGQCVSFTEWYMRSPDTDGQ